MNIELTTDFTSYKTQNGREVRIICIDAPGVYPVIAMDKRGNVFCYTANGASGFNPGCRHDLIRVNPWDNFIKDQKVLVRDILGGTYLKRHFSHVDSHGCPHTFQDGLTSWTIEQGRQTVSWKECISGENRGS